MVKRIGCGTPAIAATDQRPFTEGHQQGPVDRRADGLGHAVDKVLAEPAEHAAGKHLRLRRELLAARQDRRQQDQGDQEQGGITGNLCGGRAHPGQSRAAAQHGDDRARAARIRQVRLPPPANGRADQRQPAKPARRRHTIVLGVLKPGKGGLAFLRKGDGGKRQGENHQQPGGQCEPDRDGARATWPTGKYPADQRPFGDRQDEGPGDWRQERKGDPGGERHDAGSKIELPRSGA
jgi:hypothetical protein